MKGVLILNILDFMLFGIVMNLLDAVKTLKNVVHKT